MAKILLEALRLKKMFGDQPILDVDRLVIADGDRIGLVGENGAGKTTLLRILSGETEPDEGTVRRLAPLAVIRQEGHAEDASDRATGSVFRAPEKHPGLSGGEMTRRRIAAALASRPQLLLADEPTTDLDSEGISVLRSALCSFQGAVLLVSHDRALLQAVCSRIWQLEGGKITDFPGTYEDWQQERRQRREHAEFEYEQYRAEKKRLKETAQRMTEWTASIKKAPTRMGNSEARLHTHQWTNSLLHISAMKKTVQDRIDRLEVKEHPEALPDIRMRLGTAHPIPGRTALTVRCESLTAGKKSLLTKTELILPSGSRTALVGPNGCGKTTLFSVITGQLPAGVDFQGDVRFHPEARVGWFDQHHDRTLDPDRTVLENASKEAVLSETLVRTVLIGLGLSREDLFKPVSRLSGGEKAKTALARLLVGDYNLLILDEPTNHLDLYTLEALEELLSSYGGTLLFVSHDERLLGKVATRTVRVENARLVSFDGPPQEMEKARRRNSSAQDLQLAITSLEMRLADLSARMSAPRRGDDPRALNDLWQQTAAELREMKKAVPSGTARK